MELHPRFTRACIEQQARRPRGCTSSLPVMLKDGCGGLDSKWTRSIAIGSKEFTGRTKHLLGVKAKGRAVLSIGDMYEVREPEAGYRVDFGLEKNDIGVENAYSWNNTIDVSTR